MKMNKIFPYIAVAIFILSNLIGCIKKQEMTISPISSSHLNNPKYKISSYYELKGLKINANPLQYKLPLNLEEIENADIIKNFNLSEKQKDFLKNNGFVIINYGKIDDISRVYREMINKGIPIFITSDTLLHLYHIQFNEILKDIEEKKFYNELISLSKAMFEESKDNYEKFDGILKEASKRNVAYFAVGLKILDNVVLPNYVKKEVNEEIKNIENHDGFAKSPIFHYKEDYSQYLPRGHYTQSEKLKKYFKAMMWYGRMAFLMKGSDLISEEDAEIATIQAVLISIDLTKIRINGKSGEELWEEIYSITSFFVGAADDLTPYEYSEAINKIFGNDFKIEDINETNLFKIKLELARLRSPKIYGGTGYAIIYPPFTKEKLNKVINKTKGMRFMGQRFVPDSYIFQQLVSPAVGLYNGSMDKKPFTMEFTYGGAARCFPRGLDVMAVLGSDEALRILEKEGDTAYVGINTSYYKQLNFLRNEFSKMNISQWNRNLYFSWIYTLKSLIKEFNESYPIFMQTEAWRYKELQTSLASWTELRHDTILYAKQSYTVYLSAAPSPSKGYVEPLPEFYLKMHALVNMMLKGLESFTVINESQKNNLIKFMKILDVLINISKDELEGKNLDKYGLFFTNFVDEINETMMNINKEARKTVMVADVHTDLNTNKCLEEGVGYINLILVVYKDDGKLILSAGPILSYYEFKQPISNRLTDEKWENMIDEIKMAPWQIEIHP